MQKLPLAIFATLPTTWLMESSVFCIGPSNAQHSKINWAAQKFLGVCFFLFSLKKTGGISVLYYQDFFLLQIAFLGVFLIFLEFLRNKKGLDKNVFFFSLFIL